MVVNSENREMLPVLNFFADAVLIYFTPIHQICSEVRLKHLTKTF